MKYGKGAAALGAQVIDFAAALSRQADNLTKVRGRLTALQEAVGRPVDLSLPQWFQVYAIASDFSPDLILELGRGYGNSTCVLGEVLAHSGSGRLVSVSYDSERCWERRTLPRLSGLITPDWLRPITIIQEDIMKVDLGSYFSGAKRVLLFWDAHGFELAYYLLGKTFPALQSKEHLVVVHDLSDSRYTSPTTAYVNDAEPRLWMGPINSKVEELIPLYEFLSRNNIVFDTPGDSVRRFLERTPPDQGDGERLSHFWESVFPGIGPWQESHWIYFSLDNRDSGRPLAFPPKDMRLGRLGPQRR